MFILLLVKKDAVPQSTATTLSACSCPRHVNVALLHETEMQRCRPHLTSNNKEKQSFARIIVRPEPCNTQHQARNMLTIDSEKIKF